MKRLTFFLGSILLTSLVYFSCYAQTISSVELINNAKQYDGKVVEFKGEVVGDIMSRGDYVWLSVNDGPNALGAWCNKKLIKDIYYVGGYKVKGDIIEISGIFKRSCPEHGGDLDIHAQAIRKIVSGEPIYRATTLKKFYISLMLFIFALLVYLLRKLALIRARSV